MKRSILLLLALILSLTVEPLLAQTNNGYIAVEARQNANDLRWGKYKAVTVNHLKDYKNQPEQPLSKYGGWKVWKQKATGFFSTALVNDRWWIIDPEGYPMLHIGVVAVEAGTSENQKKAFQSKFQNKRNWAAQGAQSLRQFGFNGAGAWSDVEALKTIEQPLVYTVIISPMDKYKRAHLRNYGGKYEEAGWQGYRYDLAMVFDPEFDEHIAREVKKVTAYKNDKYLLGYFTDNELPWVFDALDRHLKLLKENEAGHIAAKKWLKKRKGARAEIADITDEDREAFTGFYFETYMKKVTKALKAEDPNHLYLGCRFNQFNQKQELTNPTIFKIAGKYMDVISINHYRKWQPEQVQMQQWEQWSGKPFLITEWYVKGEDSGLPNETGAGWNVKTQKERGYFYQNFTLELLKSKGCVGWHWFRYMDNDPSDLTTDPSNRDSNKGVVNSNYEPYDDLLNEAEQVNKQSYHLIQYFKQQQTDATKQHK